MARNNIIRIWGYADAYELIFQMRPSGEWTASVPSDMEDGQYAAEIHAEDGNGNTCIWTGILYMNQGKHCLHLNEKNYTFWLRPPVLSVTLTDKESGIMPISRETLIELIPPQYTIKLRRCCRV